MRKRKSQNLPSSVTYLILTEGSVEKLYFDSVKGKIRSSSVTIFPKEAKHSSLAQLVDTAEKAFCEGVYDKIFIVFDRDVQKKFSKTAQTKLARLEKKQAVVVIDSYPAFEVWFLAHFCLPASHYSGQDAVIRELKKYVKDYSKRTEWHQKKS